MITNRQQAKLLDLLQLNKNQLEKSLHGLLKILRLNNYHQRKALEKEECSLEDLKNKTIL
jgi:hypothetical protein